MSQTFLKILPLELCSTIYDYVLMSPNGVVQLVRSYVHPRPGKPVRYRIFTADSGLEGEIRLSFIRTCKPIYNECKDLFWKRNTLDLESIIQISNRGGLAIPGIPTLLDSLKLKVHAVQLDINFFHQLARDGREFTDILVNIGRWATHGRLHTVTLVARDKYDESNSSQLSRKTFDALVSLCRSGNRGISPNDPQFAWVRNPYYDYVDILRKVAGEHGCLANVKRKLIINTGHPEFDNDKNGFPKHWRTLKSKHNAPDMLQELSAALDGDVEVDGVICFRSGIVVSNIFLVSSNQMVSFRRDLEIWVASRYAVKNLATSKEEKKVGYWLERMTADKATRLELVRQFHPHIDKWIKVSRYSSFPSSADELKHIMDSVGKRRRAGLSKTT